MNSLAAQGTILLVDDTPDRLELMRVLLLRAGYHTLTADNGRKALEIVKNRRPNLVVSDVAMPSMSGIELCRTMRADAELSGIPVLLVSALRKDTEDIVDGLQSGAFDYLEAPYDPAHLLAKVERLIELNRASTALRESEEKYRLLVEQAADGILILDPQGTIIEVNTRVCEMFGYECDEILRRDVTEFIAVQELVTNPLQFNDLLAGKTVLNVRYIRRRDGSLIPIEISAKLLEDGRLQAIVRDITERARAEKERAHLAAIIESSDDAIIGETPERIIVSWNRGAERIFGYTAKEAIGRSISILFPPNYQDEMPHFLKGIARGESIRNYEAVRRRKDGQLLNVSITLSPIKDEAGEVTGISAIIRDVTERKQVEKALRESEQRYRAIVENARDIIYTHDMDGRFLALNKAGEQITGYTLEEARRMNITDVIAPEYIEKVRRMIADKLADREVTIYDLEIIAKDGRRIALEISSRLLYEDGEIKGIQGIARDVTERKRAAEALQQVEDQLRQSQKLEAIGQLAGGVAHDFNNLLTVITGYSDLLLRRFDKDDPVRYKINEIKKAAERATSLTRQLLAFSRKQVLQPKILDLNIAIDDLSKMLRRLIGENIRLTLRLAREVNCVNADPGQIEQILMNLVVNARDALPGGGEIIIETANVELDETYPGMRGVVSPGRYVLLAVSDDGTGMDPETQKHIFEPFFTTKEMGRGTGLGLSTVYGIVKQSGGYIWVYSKVGGGTTFKIYLPEVKEEAEELPEKVDEYEEAPRGAETILLVEDEAEVREVTCRILEGYGYRVLTAADGEEALRICKRYDKQIHLMITDIIMPRMSGRELAEQITRFRPEIPVLYISGYTNEAALHHGNLSWGAPLLEKPFIGSTLSRKVREVLDAQLTEVASVAEDGYTGYGRKP